MILKLLGATAFAALAVAAQATAIVYNFSGVLNDIRDFGNGTAVVSHFANGDEFKGSFFYDPASPFDRMIEPNRALFSGPGDLFAATISGISVSGDSRQVQLFDNYPYDMVFISSQVYALPPELQSGTYLAVLRVQLRDDSGRAVNNMALPNRLLLPDYTRQRHFGLTGYNVNGGFAWHLAGDIQDLAVEGVPEPATWTLMIAGFGLVGNAARRRRHIGDATNITQDGTCLRS